MLRSVAFVLLGVFIVLLAVGIMTWLGYVRVGRQIAPPVMPAPTNSGYIQNINISSNPPSLLVNPVSGNDFTQFCQASPQNPTVVSCPVSANVQITVSPLNKNLDLSSASATLRTARNSFSTVLFQFDFSAGEITKITEK